MGVLDKVLKAGKLLSLVEQLLRYAPLLIGTTVAAAISGWAAGVTEAVSAYQPISWIAAAFAGCFAFLGCYALWCYARVSVARLEYAKEQRLKSEPVNVIDSVFTGKRIDLGKFRSQFNAPIQDKTFVDCELHGPASICLMLGGRIAITGAAISNCEFVKVRDDMPVHVINPIPFQNLTITRGRLTGLTIFVPANAAPAIEQGIQGLTWLTR